MREFPDKNSKKPLYEQLYEQLKTDILTGRLQIGERLPSKRALAEQLQISVITVENAYSQLIAEGYVRSAQRSGYYVLYSGVASELNPRQETIQPPTEVDSDDPSEPVNEELFPFSVWARLMRQVILEKGTALLRPVQNCGAYELRRAVSDCLYRTRGFYQPPERIIIGSGAEYLYNLLIQLLGREKRFAAENPGFPKLPKIYGLNGVNFEYIPLDGFGMKASELSERRVDVAHISPAHHFPTGIVMPISRRLEIVRWASGGERYIIEDDYDSDFRWSGKPLPTMFGEDLSGSVVYINTFSQTIAPSVRISYMCLPYELYEQWQRKLGFYANSVPVLEQLTLAKFISEGYYERHINRTKKHFRRVRELVLKLFSRYEGAEVSEVGAGLHFTVRISANHRQILSDCGRCGIGITSLSQYYAENSICDPNLYVVNFIGANENELNILLQSGLIK